MSEIEDRQYDKPINVVTLPPEKQELLATCEERKEYNEFDSSDKS